MEPKSRTHMGGARQNERKTKQLLWTILRWNHIDATVLKGGDGDL